MSIRSGSPRWAGAVALLLGLALLAWACDGDDDFLIDGGTPTATPPGIATPTGTATPGPTPTPTPSGAETPTPTATPAIDVTSVTPFEITVGEAVNIREGPSTNFDILGAIFPGERKTVIGEARGEEALPGQGDLWYALEEGGFVYASLVEKVEE